MGSEEDEVEATAAVVARAAAAGVEEEEEAGVGFFVTLDQALNPVQTWGESE